MHPLIYVNISAEVTCQVRVRPEVKRAMLTLWGPGSRFLPDYPLGQGYILHRCKPDRKQGSVPWSGHKGHWIFMFINPCNRRGSIRKLSVRHTQSVLNFFVSDQMTGQRSGLNQNPLFPLYRSCILHHWFLWSKTGECIPYEGYDHCLTYGAVQKVDYIFRN